MPDCLRKLRKKFWRISTTRHAQKKNCEESGTSYVMIQSHKNYSSLYSGWEHQDTWEWLQLDSCWLIASGSMLCCREFPNCMVGEVHKLSDLIKKHRFSSFMCSCHCPSACPNLGRFLFGFNLVVWSYSCCCLQPEMESKTTVCVSSKPAWKSCVHYI